MAFDAAASAVQPPPSGAGAAAKSAAPKGDASDPFGALLAMVGNDRAAQDAPKATPAPPKNDKGGDSVAAPAKADDDNNAPIKDEAPADGAAPDSAALVAAMMAPTQAVSPPPPPPPSAPAPAEASQATAQAAAPAPVATDVAANDVAALAKDAVDLEIAPPTTVAKAEPAKAEVSATSAAVPPFTDAPVKAVAAPVPAPAVAEATRVPAATAAVTDTPVMGVAAPAEAVADATPQAAAPAEPTRPADQSKQTASDQPKIETATNQAVQNPDGRQDGAQEHNGGRQSDAEASQIAEAKKASTPDAAQQVASLDVADAAPTVNTPTPPPPPTPAVAAPVIQAQAAIVPVRGSPETVAHLAAQMIQRLDGQTTRFDLSLNPQSLGRVDVRIEIGAHGVLKARMAFDDAASAHELSGRHAELRAALQSAGFDVPEGAITYDVASGGPGGGAFAERQDGGSNGAPAFYNLADTADQDPAAVVKNYFSAAGSSGVDIRV